MKVLLPINHARRGLAPSRFASAAAGTDLASSFEQEQASRFVEGMNRKIPPGRLQVVDVNRGLGDPGRDDVVVTFVPADPADEWPPEVVKYLEHAIAAGADVIPVALGDNQRPPRPLSNRAAFSVAATSLSYRLRPNQTAEVGAVFTRDALARLWPTYSRRRLRLFLSHRRADGADLVRQLASALSDLNHRPLRDQTFVRPGRDIGASVAQTLNQADVFVLCDTPAAAGEHAWLTDELCVALGLGIPIVWVRFGQIGCRSELEIRPADEPDLDENWPTDDQSFHEVADRILDRSLIAGRNQIRRVESCLTRAGQTMGVEVLDPRRRILLLTRPRLIGQFKLTDRIVVQAFSRRPNAKDAKRFHQWLRERKMMSGPERRRTYDLAVMIGPSPSPSPTASRGRGDWDADGVTGVQSSDAGSLVSALNRAAANSPRSPDGRELLLFAAMGPGQGAVQEFRDAVNDVATFWLGQGGRIRFGGHPTVTATVNWVASAEVPGRERDHVVIYQSEFFVTPQLLAEISSIATVVGTPIRGEGDSQRAQSLTHMRELMIGGSSAVAAIVVGGRTYAESGRPPGIEEEVQIARRQGIPVYVLGATGGEAALIAERIRQQSPPFADLGNQLSSAENEFLATTDDYSAAAQLIWTASGPSE